MEEERRREEGELERTRKVSRRSQSDLAVPKTFSKLKINWSGMER